MVLGEATDEAAVLRGSPGSATGDASDLLALAVKRRLDATAAALLTGPTSTGAWIGMGELVRADMADSAVALARKEAGPGAQDLAEAVAEETDNNGFLHVAAGAGASARMVQALMAAGCRPNQSTVTTRPRCSGQRGGTTWPHARRLWQRVPSPSCATPRGARPGSSQRCQAR